MKIMEEMMKQMEINEEKSIKNTYLYVKNVGINHESYETKVMLEENIENTIKFQIVYDAENEILKYDVSRTLSFEEYLKTHKLNKNDICDILDSLDRILSNVENYLLPENVVSLDLKMIRVMNIQNNAMSYKFTMIPNNNVDFSYELSKFLIRILRYIDVSDKNALTLAYSLFVRSSKDNYTMNDLMELIDNEREYKKNKNIDEDALNAYDEEQATLYEEPENDASFFPDFDFLSENDDSSVISKRNISDNKNKIIKKDTYIDDNNDSIDMDSDTKNVINDELFDSFDNKKKHKFLSAHINIISIKNIIPKLIFVVIPILSLIYSRREKLVMTLSIILLMEIIFLIAMKLEKMWK